MVIGHLLEPVLARIVRQRIEGDDRAREIVEQRIEPLMEQRQPMLHALVLLPRRDGLVERVVALHGPEQLHIALAKAAAHLRRQRHLAHGQKVDRLDAGFGALGFRIEGADGFERVAEEVEPDRLPSRREEIENTAAHRILAGIGHRAGSHIASGLQPLHQLPHVQDVAGA